MTDETKEGSFENAVFNMTIVVVVFSLLLGGAAILMPAK
jgi:hypothetical protein